MNQITREQAFDLAKYRYKLVDKEGNVYNIYDITETNSKTYIQISLKDRSMAKVICIDKIGCDYFILSRDLSQLTKPIDHEGESFVPIVKCGELFGYNKLERFEADNYIGYGWNETGIDDCQGYEFSYDEKNGCFGVWYDFKEDNNSPLYQCYNEKAKNLLYELHFNLGFPQETVKPL